MPLPATVSEQKSVSAAATWQPLSHDDIQRYSRHLVLSEIGMAGQVCLKNSCVLVVGVGGLASSCLYYLAAAGVGYIGVVDADTVDVSNLQRQIIHSTHTVGLSKCQSAQQALLALNPSLQLQMYKQEFTAQTALQIVQGGFTNFTNDMGHATGLSAKPYDIIVDGSDNFPTKYLINDVCALCHKTWVYSAILGFEGQLAVFNYAPLPPFPELESVNRISEFNECRSPDYRDLLPDAPPPGDIPSCAEGGVLGVVPGVMGCFQCNEVGPE
jgi:sulfur-carrier protein adenylyltransferase/sulfurtransferase